MDNKKHEETTHSDPDEPIVSWSGVQGETQAETAKMEVPPDDSDVQNEGSSAKEDEKK